MTEKMNFISIIMPAFNEEKYIEKSLIAVCELDYPRESFEIIVVDNGSKDSTVEIAKKYADKVLVIRDVRVGAVRNFGVKNSKGNIIAFLDSDCIPKQNWLSDSLNYMEKNKCDVVGGIYLLRDDPTWIESAWLVNPVPTDKLTSVLVGGAIIAKKGAFIAAGMFNEKVNAGEDYALARALVEKGFVVHLAAVSAVVHLGYPSTVLSFIRRQFWHASSYLKSRKKGELDFVFLITAMFLTAFTIIPVAYFEPGVLMFSMPFIVVLPLLLTIKRVVAVKYLTFRLDSYLKMYVLDFLYLIGRSLGLLKSILIECEILKDKKSYY
jgi:glycosyltransferase involved in cell wall biosynthesis